jgi:hypothetical protein
MSNQIELITRRNIIDAFSISRIAWYGELEQQNFLGRLFDLSKLASFDARYTTASEDIHKHTVMNDDWPQEWVFTDSRFNILHLPDSVFLDFLCMTIHPAVRSDEKEITTLLEIYQNNLGRNGFTLIKTSEIASKPVFSPAAIGKSAASASTTSAYAVAATAVSIAKPENRQALVIGCSIYDHSTPLINPLNDANDMEAKLQTLGFEVIKKIDPTQKELKTIIDEFGEKLKGADVGLFYFAGHGVQVKGLNYLVPRDANITSEKIVEYDCVEANRVLAHMEDTHVPIKIMVLDACRNNPFERSWGRGIGQRGLATMNAPKGSLIAYSTSPGTTASDGTGKNGLYTEALLNHIAGKGTPVNTMFQKVRLEVMEKSKEEQVSWESTSLTADFYFNN